MYLDCHPLVHVHDPAGRGPSQRRQNLHPISLHLPRWDLIQRWQHVGWNQPRDPPVAPVQEVGVLARRAAAGGPQQVKHINLRRRGRCRRRREVHDLDGRAPLLRRQRPRIAATSSAGTGTGTRPGRRRGSSKGDHPGVALHLWLRRVLWPAAAVVEALVVSVVSSFHCCLPSTRGLRWCQSRQRRVSWGASLSRARRAERRVGRQGE